MGRRESGGKEGRRGRKDESNGDQKLGESQGQRKRSKTQEGDPERRGKRTGERLPPRYTSQNRSLRDAKIYIYMYTEMEG